MQNKDYISKSFVHAAGVLIYVSAVALFLSNGENIFGKQVDNFLAPLLMLLLLIVSASITGLLGLGKPILLYFNNHKKEAFKMLFATLAWIATFAIIVILVLISRAS